MTLVYLDLLKFTTSSFQKDTRAEMVNEKAAGMLVGASIACLMVYMFFGDWSDQNSSIMIGFSCGSLATYMIINQ